MEKREEVVSFLIKRDDETKKMQVLLGLKTQKIGKDKRNGYGGGIGNRETAAQAAARELGEELGVYVKSEDLIKMGVVEIIIKTSAFRKFSHNVTIFTLHKWKGTFIESEEMIDPIWFNINELPDMIKTDKLWLPYILNGDYVEGTIEKKVYGQQSIKVSLEIIGPELK